MSGIVKRTMADIAGLQADINRLSSEMELLKKGFNDDSLYPLHLTNISLIAARVEAAAIEQFHLTLKDINL